jgi:hypothetical protein
MKDLFSSRENTAFLTALCLQQHVLYQQLAAILAVVLIVDAVIKSLSVSTAAINTAGDHKH